MIQFEEYKGKLTALKPKLDDLAVSLNLEADGEELERLHAQIEAPGFWDNQELSQKVMKRARQLETKAERYQKMCTSWEDLLTICEMALEENDDSMLENPRDREENRLLLARGERLWKETLGEVREQVGRVMEAFQEELASQEPARILRARSRCKELLDRLEAGSGLNEQNWDDFFDDEGGEDEE